MIADSRTPAPGVRLSAILAAARRVASAATPASRHRAGRARRWSWTVTRAIWGVSVHDPDGRQAGRISSHSSPAEHAAPARRSTPRRPGGLSGV